MRRFLYIPFCDVIEQTNLSELCQNPPEYCRILAHSSAPKIFWQPECGALEIRQNGEEASIDFSSKKYSGNPHIPALFAGMSRIPILFRSGRPKIKIPGAIIANLKSY